MMGMFREFRFVFYAADRRWPSRRRSRRNVLVFREEFNECDRSNSTEIVSGE